MLVPPPAVKYSHYGTIGAIIFIMLYILGIWLNEYHNIIKTKKDLTTQTTELRQSIYQEAYQFQEAVNIHDRMLQERQVLERRLAETQRRQNEKPTAQPLWSIERPMASSPPPPPPKVEDTNIPSKIELLGILEVELSETTSWHTVIKMIVTVLVTFFGIKLINLIFKRLENSVA